MRGGGWIFHRLGIRLGHSFPINALVALDAIVAAIIAAVVVTRCPGNRVSLHGELGVE
jgi:hypothetical protein